MSHAPPLARPAAWTLLFLALAAAFVAATILLVPGSALATQPPPPATYELTITKVGGDNNCKFGAEPPAPVQWEVTQFQRTYTASTQITLRQIIDCPSEYRFDHWESSEDAVDGQIDLQKVAFNISKNTWVKAHFVAVTPRVTSFSKTGLQINPDTRNLTVNYEWGSSSGELSDLANQKIIEVFSYDASVSFDPDVLAFLCTGMDNSAEQYELSSPWDEMTPPDGKVPKLKTIRQGGTLATTGSSTDTHSRPTRPSGCTSKCSYTIWQWHVTEKSGGQGYLVGGPHAITRSYEWFQGSWIYTIEKHGETRMFFVP